jgi:hypothetical protein
MLPVVDSHLPKVWSRDIENPRSGEDHLNKRVELGYRTEQLSKSIMLPKQPRYEPCDRRFERKCIKAGAPLHYSNIVAPDAEKPWVCYFLRLCDC